MKRLLFVVLLLAGATTLPIAPAQASGACSGTSGVTVVVQFKDEPVQVGCATGDPASGYQALRDAGFPITNVTGQPQAICTINGQPDLKQETCWGKTNFWSYWHGKAGGGWGWANSGASYNPKPGEFEGWHFGTGQTGGGPDYSLPAAPTPKPTAHPTVHPTAAHPTGGASNPVVGPDETPTANTSSSAGATSAPGAGSQPTATATDDSTPTAGPTGAGAVANDPVSPRSAATDSSSGGSRSWIWGVVLIGVVGTAAATTAVRRRRS